LDSTEVNSLSKTSTPTPQQFAADLQPMKKACGFPSTAQVGGQKPEEIAQKWWQLARFRVQALRDGFPGVHSGQFP
jgi:hypothetical protein